MFDKKNNLIIIHCQSNSYFTKEFDKVESYLNHIYIKFLIVKERVQSGQISIEHLETNFMITDLLIKEFSPNIFHELVIHMGVLAFEKSLV